MPRKSIGTLEDQREAVRRRYRRGPRAISEVTGDGSLDEHERHLKQEMACFLKAQDFSYSYIGDVLNVSKGTVKLWFSEQQWMREKVAQVREDIAIGALKLLKTYMLEIVESLMDLARSTADEKLAAEIYRDLLDRGGLAKVNKSESVSAKTLRTEGEIDITDKTGLLERTKNASAEVQSKMAEHLEDLMALAHEHGEEAGA